MHLLTGKMRRVVFSIVMLVSFIFCKTISAADQFSSVQAVIVFDKQEKSRSLADLPPTIFRHDLHEKLYKCSVCHPELFIDKIGANIITMKEQMLGKYCGRCHDGIQSFGMSDCSLCHVEKKE